MEKLSLYHHYRPSYQKYKNQLFALYSACKILIKIKLGRKKSRYIQPSKQPQLTFDGYPCIDFGSQQ